MREQRGLKAGRRCALIMSNDPYWWAEGRWNKKRAFWIVVVLMAIGLIGNLLG